MSGGNGHRADRLRVEVTPYERRDGRQETRVDLINDAGDTVASLGWGSALELAGGLIDAVAMTRESTVESGLLVHAMPDGDGDGDGGR